MTRSARMDAFILRIWSLKSYVDPNIYIKVMNNEDVIILLYVDDIFITVVENIIQEFKNMLENEFEMKDLGLMHYYLLLEL